MIRKGRIVTDRQATALIPTLPVDRAQAPAWLAATAAPAIRDPFAPTGMPQGRAANDNAQQPELDPQAQHDAMMRQLEAEAAKLKSMQTRYAEGIAKLAAQSVARPASPERVLDLVLLIAREVIGREAQTDPAIILEHVEAGIAALGGEELPQVRMTAAEIDVVIDLKPELADAARFVPDESVGIGGCVVENSRRVVDASLDERLEAVRGALAEALGTGAGTQRKVA
ncbi:MAG TPA: FliH/SctL family protein [Polyangia bacterium]|jgi:flagellar biosynthesis/type III secretory pathway protein FliH|nr:FliH/SctL family protein [Polyangia bacterium]